MNLFDHLKMDEHKLLSLVTKDRTLELSKKSSFYFNSRFKSLFEFTPTQLEWLEHLKQEVDQARIDFTELQ